MFHNMNEHLVCPLLELESLDFKNHINKVNFFGGKHNHNSREWHSIETLVKLSHKESYL